MWTEHAADADKLNEMAVSLIARLLQKHTASILEEVHAQIAKTRADTLREAAAAVRRSCMALNVPNCGAAAAVAEKAVLDLLRGAEVAGAATAPPATQGPAAVHGEGE